LDNLEAYDYFSEKEKLLFIFIKAIKKNNRKTQSTYGQMKMIKNKFMKILMILKIK